MMKKNCSIIYNPATASFNEKVLNQTVGVFSQEYNVNKKRSEYAGHVLSLVKEANEESDLVVTYGGDGTFGEAVTGIYNEEQKALLSHIPAGTTNDLKRNFKLSSSAAKSAELILNGEEQEIDIFTLNNVAFAYVGAFGLLANAPCNTSAKLKAKIGHLAYLITGGKEFFSTPPVYNITCQANGLEWQMDCLTGIITNSIGFGGMKLLRDIDLNDGLIEVSLIRNISRKEMLMIGRDIILKRFDINNYKQQIVHLKTNHAKITFNNQIPADGFDLDGENLDVLRNNQQFDVTLGRKLKLLLPKR